MSMDEGNGRITVSVDKLRAELGQLELRIVDRLTHEIAKKADAEELRSLRHRVQTIENQGPLQDRLFEEFLSSVRKIDGLESFKAKAIGGIAVAILLASATGVKAWIGL